MARINKNKMISGAIGNVVFRDTGGRQILLSKPDGIRQTRKTKESSSEFQQCSRWAKRLRIGLNPFLGKHTDTYMHSRFTGQLYNVLQTNSLLDKGARTPLNSNMESLAGFEFNTRSPFSDYFVPMISTVLNSQNKVEVTIPEFNPKGAMRFGENANHAELLIYVIATDFHNNTGFIDGYTTIPIGNKSYGVPETVWTSPAMPMGNLVLVCAKLLFYNINRFTEKHYINNKGCSPAQIVMARKGL